MTTSAPQSQSQSQSQANGHGATQGVGAAPPAYGSQTELGKEIAVLSSLWRSLPPSPAGDALAASIGRLAALDQNLIAYDAQVAAYSERCKAIVANPRTVGAGAPSPGSPPGVSAPAAVGIGAIGILAGGVAGYLAARSLAGPKDSQEEPEE